MQQELRTKLTFNNKSRRRRRRSRDDDRIVNGMRVAVDERRNEADVIMGSCVLAAFHDPTASVVGVHCTRFQLLMIILWCLVVMMGQGGQLSLTDFLVHPRISFSLFHKLTGGEIGQSNERRRWHTVRS